MAKFKYWNREMTSINQEKSAENSLSKLALLKEKKSVSKKNMKDGSLHVQQLKLSPYFFPH
jgi:hypothetical protein